MACIYTEHKTLPVVEILVDGRVTEHDMDQILPKMEVFIEKHGKVRMVEIIERFEGFDPSTILDGIKFDVKHMTDLTHVAVVTDTPWIGFMTRAAAAVVPLTIRVFDLDALDEARAWIAAPEKA